MTAARQYQLDVLEDSVHLVGDLYPLAHVAVGAKTLEGAAGPLCRFA